ncbi:MAG: hypothetical protein WD896_01165, partial [Parcubacteria group bacterium]
MFLPSTDSFVLTRGTIVKPSFPVFLPNTDSFVLIRRSVVDPTHLLEAENAVATVQETANLEEVKVSDHGKRNFLKVAGIAGAGLIVSQLSPKKAQALIMGSSPTTGVVGVKDATNVR